MASFKQRLFGDMRGAGFCTSRFIGGICTLVLIALSAKYINDLVMTRTASAQPVPIALLVVVSQLMRSSTTKPTNTQ